LLPQVKVAQNTGEESEGKYPFMMWPQLHSLRYHFLHPAGVERHVTKENRIRARAINSAQSNSIELSIAKKWTAKIGGTNKVFQGLYTNKICIVLHRFP